MTEEEIEDKIEDWHFHGAGEGQDLHEFLGWTLEEYQQWAVTGILPNASN